MGMVATTDCDQSDNENRFLVAYAPRNDKEEKTCDQLVVNTLFKPRGL
jgi:hypothetical protein